MTKLSGKDGGFDIADRDAGAPRDALAIYESGQDGLSGYRVEAGAYVSYVRRLKSYKS
jgi:hypothetical protein